MIHACDKCAKENGLVSRCPVSDGPFGCVYCKLPKAVAVYSTDKGEPYYKAIFWTLFFAGVFYFLKDAAILAWLFASGQWK